MARHFQEAAPGSVLDVADAFLLRRLREVMDEVEDYWEAATARTWQGVAARPHHNLASWGWDLRHALSRRIGSLRNRVESAEGRGDAVFKQLPSAAWERSALTLTGGDDRDTPVSLARLLGEESDGEGPGIETLVVALGANNILGTVLDFEVRWTDPATQDFRDVDAKRGRNAWLPSTASEFDALVDEVTHHARHVIFLGPARPIAPMVRGVRNKMPGDRYFARYTRAVTDQVFNANRHPCLTGDDLRVLDFAVDRYNDHIARRVPEARTAQGGGRDWRLLDVAGILDRLAYRRYLIDDEARPDWWTPYVLPDAYRELSPQPDTRFYRADARGRTRAACSASTGSTRRRSAMPCWPARSCA